jgi:thymidylate synthase
MYGLTELQHLIADSIGVQSGKYHHYIDSLIIDKQHYESLQDIFQN